MGYSTGRRPWRSEPFSEAQDDNRSARHKVFYFGVLVVFLFGILTLQLARLQLVNGDEYSSRAETNRLRQTSTMPTRGLIYDRNGVPLVENHASFAAAVVAADIPGVDTSGLEAVCTEECLKITIALQELTGVPAGDIESTILQRTISNDPFTPAIIKEDMPEEMAFRIRERLAALPGVRVEIESQRSYTQGTTMAHVLGFVGRLNEEEYDGLSDAGYQLNDQIGKTGVELTYESILRGSTGVREIETDASGRELRLIDEQPAEAGSDIILSIDLDLQEKVTEYLTAAMGESKNAAAAVIDVNTGEMLSLVSLPNYDNNVFTTEVETGTIEELLTDPGKPLLNHALAETYAPGSTFKQVTGLGALQDGIATADTQIFSPGVIYVTNQYDSSIRYAFKDWRSDLGLLNFYRGVAMSSDVYFYYLAGGYSENGIDQFQGLGAKRLAEWARRFGLGELTGIDLPGESAGLVPDPTWKQETLSEVWTIGDTYNFGIGQGYLTATPLQMLLVTAAVANGGDVLVPHVVKEVRSSDGQVQQLERQTVKRNLNIDQRNIEIMQESMRQAVADGSAYTAAAKSVTVAGKTGTAEFGPQRPDGSYQEHGWFTGFAPVENPEIAVVVYLEQGNGQGTAAPVGGKILEYYYARKNMAQAQTP